MLRITSPGNAIGHGSIRMTISRAHDHLENSVVASPFLSCLTYCLTGEVYPTPSLDSRLIIQINQMQKDEAFISYYELY